MMNKKRVIFVTGAGGFIGSRVVRYYRQNEEQAIGIGHGSSDTITVAASINSLSLKQLTEQFGLPDLIINCAGSASVSFSIEHPREDYQKNVEVLFQILEFIRLHSPCTRLVHLSSAAVYGEVADRTPLRENLLPDHQVSPYGFHKRLTEELCGFYSSYWKLSIIIIRFFSIYGEGLKKQLLWDACRKFEKKEYGFCGTGEEERDWLHIDDAVALIQSAEKHASSQCQIVNGGSGKACSIKDLLTCMGQLWTPCAVPVFSKESRPGDPSYLVADIDKINAWGYRPQINLNEGLASYVRWYKTEGYLC